MMEKVDLDRAKQIMADVKAGKIKVTTYLSYEKPSPLAYHILSKYGDITELMAPEKVLVNNIDKLKMAIDARETTLLCMKCGEWTHASENQRVARRTSMRQLRLRAAGAALSLAGPSQTAGCLKRREKAKNSRLRNSKKSAKHDAKQT